MLIEDNILFKYESCEILKLTARIQSYKKWRQLLIHHWHVQGPQNNKTNSGHDNATAIYSGKDWGIRTCAGEGENSLKQ